MDEDSGANPAERLIEERYGLALSGWQRDRIAGTLHSTIARFHGPELSPDQLRMLAEELTVGESYFFREPAHIDVLLDVALPERLEAAGSARPIRILSAGCASGEEAYSLAIALEERAPAIAERVQILGIDINRQAIRKARQARYSAWSLRTTTERVRNRWFEWNGDDYALRRNFHAAVTFEERNLLDQSDNFWAAETFDVIFCRNVIIYFSERSTSAVTACFVRALYRGGFLFLGHSEILRGLSDNFEPLHSHGTFYHRRRGSAPAAGVASAPVESSHAWAEEIDAATRRIADRARSRPATIPPPPPPSIAAVAVDYSEQVLDLIETERFDDALGLLGAIGSSTPPEPRVDLWTAVVLVSQDRLGEAEPLCRKLLHKDGFEAVASYLLGVCSERQTDRGGARRRYEQAARMDARFAMPWLRLGLLDRRAGHAAGARECLTNALDRFRSEREDRIRLLGGGFPREAFVELCRTQLSTLEPTCKP